ncbi:MAG TPA: O-antigen ligase family protein [Bacteroidales bacterium]|nr:O-antigen ligase family protein [Bacteroidales bacterium]
MLFIPNIIGFGFPLLCKRFDIAKFFRIVSITLIFVSIWFLKIYLDYLDDGYSKKAYYEPILGLYLSCASFMGLNILVILGAKKRIFKNLFVSSFVVTLTIILLFLLGARGPFIFVLLLLIPLFVIKYIYSYYFNKVLLSDFKKALYSGLTVLLFFVFFLIFEKEVKVLLDRSVFRISLLMPSSDSETSSVPTTSNTTKSSSVNTSVDTRIDQLKFSIDLIKNNKFESIYGFGVGSFGILYLQKDFRAYPHNIFLEIWVELGLIGLILFLIFLFFVFSKNLNGTNYINLLVLVYIILNVLKSSSYVDIRVFFAVFAMYMLSSNDKSLNEITT